MKVADVMMKNVICTSAAADVHDVARTMLRHNISGVPVLDGAHHLIGIVTEGDLLRRAEYGAERHRSKVGAFLAGPGKLASEFVRSHSRRVDDVMTRNVLSVTEETSLQDAVGLMEKHRIKRLPVVSAGRGVGIVSRSDLVRLLGAAPPPPASRSDQALCDDITQELRKHPWAGQVRAVRVHDGNVEVRGIVFHEDERRAIAVAIENLPGVKSVRDQLVWVEPYTGSVVAEPGTPGVLP